MSIQTDTSAQVDFLDAQCADFQQMQGLGRRQRECLIRDDLEGLSEAMTQMQELMVKVRVRQRDMAPGLTHHVRRQPEVAERVERLRHLIESISQVRTQSETAAQHLLGETRAELDQSNRQRKATRGYGLPARVNEPRFTDGFR
ncbi:MAG: hypothetical protein HOM68_28240 [Gemmatimonadetes bacterium]|jgi:ribonuclease D|nr:hypothetical protein [Gemmatimonadota bacterium]MBT5060467.1 hypothetical protein [Gemmatimonadota bacterium]MBT5142562.1 hypothetical protein [Gemmatimonadota bacterium]MBT5592083.1 hypothetical protein [Gemmatimonadota bacterium]MBT5961141.1 hypothetical protein [Gemmatimonadota bacterium]